MTGSGVYMFDSIVPSYLDYIGARRKAYIQAQEAEKMAHNAGMLSVWEALWKLRRHPTLPCGVFPNTEFLPEKVSELIDAVAKIVVLNEKRDAALVVYDRLYSQLSEERAGAWETLKWAIDKG